MGEVVSHPRVVMGAIIAMQLFWYVLAGVLAGVLLGWRVPVALVLFAGFLYLRGRIRAGRGTRARATVEFFAFSIVGGVLGAFAFGGLGAIFGTTYGFIARLAEEPISREPSFRLRRRKT